MFDRMEIQSYKGPYSVTFNQGFPLPLPTPEIHFIIDSQVASLFSNELKEILNSHSILLIEATEQAKSLEAFPSYVEHLVNHGLRRHHCLIAIGGGIIGDITCFLAATLLRGVAWKFYPTTLLSQADSCIGSKSSINCCDVKNILGTFTPPKEIFINIQFLDTLSSVDIRSGIGEMLKVHAIESLAAFNLIAKDYQTLLSDKMTMLHYVKCSLKIKKGFIEKDEFDRGPRNLLNYGHSFGHAIEVATQYRVPHGIAVTMGMDIANYIAMQLGLASQAYYQTMHPVLFENYKGFSFELVDLDLFFKSLSKDKKNVDRNSLALILPNQEDIIQKMIVSKDSHFSERCEEFFRQECLL